MNQKLWDMIQLFSGKEVIGANEMALARQSLDADVFQVFKEQVEKGIITKTLTWI
ncbi:MULTISPECIES: hypothetical protein [unclassified Sporolactobacillus]|uniref:hypothetical protein n=1 Tax=unclassified Sporolactobacillus TaxID=2628533 RepID=UPI0023687C5D|nr:hypothetical protein [Sporolactobacillus sp. CQH2019]MDD9150347.1 hypothetical protein [Sporolactobacillus sp. CQH2019]